MNDLFDDNRFELIEKYKKELIDATNIETAPDEMAVLDNILFRFWQMGWLDSVDRMPLVKESARTLMHSVGDSISAKAFRNAGRFVQNAIDGEPPDFEKLPPAQPETHGKRTETHGVCLDVISRQAAIDALDKQIRQCDKALASFDIAMKDEYAVKVERASLIAYRETLEYLPSAQPERTCVNCGRTANNGGWYADGRTRCPIEEHYALPKDGYCHLWEKRNVTDDDYPERREE